MNKLLYIVLFAGLLGGVYACKKEKLLTYDAPDSIYFQLMHITTQIDSTSLSFAYSPASVQDSTIMIPVAVTGVAAKTDREYSVAVDPASTAKQGTHYVLPSKFVLPAGVLIDSFPVKFTRTTDLQDTTLKLVLDLKQNVSFHTDIPIFIGSDTVNALSVTISVSDIMVPGPYWTSIFNAYFGSFSVKKVKLLNQVTGMPLDFPINGIFYAGLTFGAQASNYAITMSRYLEDQAASGHTVYEDDGVTPMVMAASYQ